MPTGMVPSRHVPPLAGEPVQRVNVIGKFDPTPKYGVKKLPFKTIAEDESVGKERRRSRKYGDSLYAFTHPSANQIDKVIRP